MLGCAVKFWRFEYEGTSDQFIMQNSSVFVFQDRTREEMVQVQALVSSMVGDNSLKEILDNFLPPLKDEILTVEPIIKSEREYYSDPEESEAKNVFEQNNWKANKAKNFDDEVDWKSDDEKETKARDYAKSDLTLTCSFCPRQFKFEKSLRKHEELHLTDPDSPKLLAKIKETNLVTRTGPRMPRGNYQCDKCTSSFKMFAALERHIAAHDLASQTSLQKTDLDIKISDHLKCIKCDLVYSTEGMYRLHMQKYHEKALSCDECSKRFTLPSALTKHNLNYHTSFPKVCDHCGLMCLTKTEYKKHTDELHAKNVPDPEVPCEICGKLLKNKYVLKQHVKLAHDKIQQSFPCEKCGKVLKSKSSLEYHSRVHTGDLPFRCDECGKGFRRLERMMACKSNHQGIFQYNCQDCDYKTNKVGHYKNHITTHSGEKPYTCPLCNHPSSTATNLSGHCKKVHKISLCQAEGLTKKNRWGHLMNEDDIQLNKEKLEKSLKIKDTRMLTQPQM